MTYPIQPDRPPDSLPFDLAGIRPLALKWSAPAADAPPADVWKELEKKGVKVACASAACDHDLHCFRLTQKQAKALAPGTCRECQTTFVSMSRTGNRDLADVDYTFAALQREMVRHHFWHVPFTESALRDALRRGPSGLRERIPKVVRTRIGKAQPYRDGRQTPMGEKARAVDLALHAVAACCRRCANYWHGIPMGVELTDADATYLAELAWRFLDARLSGVSGWPGTSRETVAGDAQVHKLLLPSTTLATVNSTLMAS